VAEELARCNLPFEFFDAVDGSEPDFLHADRASPEKTFTRKGYSLLTTEIACFASHLQAWQYCVDTGAPLLVLEDNVELVDSMSAAVLHESMAALPDLGYIKLAARFERSHHTLAALTNTHSLARYRRGTCGTSAYRITPAGAAKLIKGAEEIVEPVDDYLEKPWRHGVIAYSVVPSLFQRSNVTSMIGSSRKKKSPVSIPAKLRIELFRVHKSILTRLYFWFKHD